MLGNIIFVDDELVDGSPSGSFVDVGDVDGDVGFGRESRSAVVCNFDTKSDGLVFFVV